jgi:hypothetical protein
MNEGELNETCYTLGEIIITKNIAVRCIVLFYIYVFFQKYILFLTVNFEFKDMI